MVYLMSHSQIPALIAAIFAIVSIPIASQGQYVYETRSDAGAVTHLHYLGGSDWLVAQSEPASHWHELPELTGVTFNNCTVTDEVLIGARKINILILSINIKINT